MPVPVAGKIVFDNSPSPYL